VTASVAFDVWSDVLCPWCYVAAVRLDRLRAELDGALELRWHSFLLQPQPRPKPLDSFRRYTERWFAPNGPAAAAPDVEFRPWRDEMPPSHSVPPAIAVEGAKHFGEPRATRYHLALMRAYFVDHRDVAARDVVIAVAQDVGIDPAELIDVLRADGTALHDRVVADHHAALDEGITAVPAVVIPAPNGRFPIPGAQELETYRRTFARVAARARETPFA
jgi:predicted DsbA family dithiol-disulfide isomerase